MQESPARGLGDFMTDGWEARLKAAYKANAPTAAQGRRVRLPGRQKDGRWPMRVCGDGNIARIELSSDAVVRNMQTSAAAFEGWSLALHRWCDAKVQLHWEPPHITASATDEAHYQRFLYRVDRFASLFGGDWFEVGNLDLLGRSRVIGAASPLFLNAPGNKQSSQPKDKREALLEDRLLRDTAFDQHFGFTAAGEKNRQVPVGLFSTPKPTRSPECMIFPGGSAAIDLVCLDASRLWVFELKAGANIPVGTLSELLFYVSVMRDLLLQRFRIEQPIGERGGLRPNKLIGVKELIGVMLGHGLAPLIADAEILRRLNAAITSRWNTAESAPLTSLRFAQITASDPLEIVEIS